ncbi:MAG: hypothetical protein QOK15_3118 [Nocardioidaceae bacterium]|jgi:hypothetical protein|nr:hypothetical protein [Nocardioidaceae bacterium]
MRRRLALLIGVVLAFVVAAAVVAVARREPRCPVAMPASTPLPQLVTASDLAPEGSVGEQRRPVLDAVAGLGRPFGGLVAGRFYASTDRVPTLVPSGGGVVLAVTRDKAGSFEAITLPGGDPLWARDYAGTAAHGGRVGDAFVVLAGGRAPAVVSFDVADGHQLACVPVPGAHGAVATQLIEQAGADVVVATAPSGGPLTLSRIDPASRVRWRQRLEGYGGAGSLTVSGGDVVVGRLGEDPARLAGTAAAGGMAAPMVSAYSLASGIRAWSYPAAGDVASTAASVVGADPSGGAAGGLVVLTARRGRSGSSTDVRERLVALDSDGGLRWSARLGAGRWGAQVVDGLVIARGADPRGGPMLRAFGLDHGNEHWTVRSREVPLVGPEARQDFGSVVQIGATLVVPSPNGLLAIAPGTGEVTRLDSKAEIEQVLPVGGVALLRTHDAVLVLRLDP